MIYIGAVYHGPELRDGNAWDLVGAMTRAVIELRGAWVEGSCPGIDIVIHVPGSLGGPDWDGCRDAKFSRKRKLLMVQVAVPRELVHSEKLKDFLIDSLRGANAIAFHFFDDKGMKYPLREAEEIVTKIKERLDARPELTGAPEPLPDL